MTYETAIELFAEGIIGYEETLMEMEDNRERRIEECPWDIEEEETKCFKRAKGLLEELRFNRMFEE